MRRVRAVAAVVLVTAGATSCAHDGRALRQPSSGQTLSIVTTSTSTSTSVGLKPAAAGSTPTTKAGATGGPLTVSMPWTEGALIDVSYTCTGGNSRPAVAWKNVPAGTAELAVLVVDDDANGFVHWLVAGVPPNAPGITAGAGLPPGAVQALSSSGNAGWSGPCPPAGASHHYRTQVYALGSASGITEGMAADAAKAALLQKPIVGLASATGVFGG